MDSITHVGGVRAEAIHRNPMGDNIRFEPQERTGKQTMTIVDQSGERDSISEYNDKRRT